MEEKGNKNIMEFVAKHHKDQTDYITRSRISSANPLDRPANKPGYAKPWLVTNPWKPTIERVTDEKKQYIQIIIFRLDLIDRKNNELVSIIKNCIDEVKRDMWYKES